MPTIDSIYVVTDSIFSLVCLATAILVFISLKQLKIMPISYYQGLVNKLTDEANKSEVSRNKLKSLNTELRIRVNELESKKSKGSWVHEQEEALRKLKELLEENE